MIITNSFLGTSARGHRCLFFLLFEDYIEAQSKFVRDFDEHLERFARNVGSSAALVQPFAGDVAQTRQHTLDKEWSEEQEWLIRYSTPALLMIDRDFDEFDPRRHPWVHLHFGTRLEDQGPDVSGEYAVRMANALQVLADAVNTPDADIFAVARNLQYEVSLHDVEEVVEVKPGAFGVSIDLIRGAKVLRKMYSRLRHRRRESRQREAGGE